MTRDNLEERISRLRAQSQHHAGEGSDSEPDRDLGRAMSFGLSMGAQFFGAVVGGGFLGWLIDRWLGTSPLAMVGLMVLFFGAALVNVWFMMSKAAARSADARGSGEGRIAGGDRGTDETDGKSS
jgi:ATP synthase protein I